MYVRKYICDICGNDLDKSTTRYKFRRSKEFVDCFDEYNTERTTHHMCEDCFIDFRNYVKVRKTAT